MKSSVCPLCEFQSVSIGRSFKGYSRGTSEELAQDISLVKCLGCSAEFLSPQPSDQALSQEYANYFQDRQDHGIAHPRVPYFKKVLSEAGLVNQKLSAIEFGGAEGDFARAFLELNPESQLLVVEKSADNKSFIQDVKCQKENLFLEEYLAQNRTQRFDYAFLFDVIEHLRDPKDSVQKILNQVLNEKGQVIATFPNVESWSQRILGSLWFQYKTEHLFYFSRQSVESLFPNCKKHELRPLIKNLPLGYLLAVASKFGPGVQRVLFSAVGGLFPKSLKRLPIPLPLGEWILHYPKKRDL